MESGRKYSAKEVLNRIDLCVLRANGIFLKTAVFNGKYENKALDDFINHHNDAFLTIFKEGTSILQATQIYASIRRLKVIIPSNLTTNLVVKSAIWSSFILENLIDIEQSNSGFNYLGYPTILDDLVSEYENYQGTVITYKERSQKIKCRSIVPKILLSKRAERVFRLATGSILNRKEQEFEMIEGGIWPENESQCHEDERIYPAIEEAMKGIRKWNLDKHFLEKNRKLPIGYKLGIYPI